MHIRRSIREAVKTQVTGLTTTGNNVFSHRVYPVQEEVLPAILVYTSSEISTPATLGGFGSVASLARTLSVDIEAYVKATGNVVDTLDTIAEEVEIALGDDETLGGLAESIQLTNTSIEITADGDQPVGVLKMGYSVVYRTTGDPTTAL